MKKLLSKIKKAATKKETVKPLETKVEIKEIVNGVEIITEETQISKKKEKLYLQTTNQGRRGRNK